ncbi:MAG: ATP synthase F1 subunit epsilon [Lachnospiraceae bacterium]|nr:ATP synthase F1 subunit epsilon [Lachnospiraceae bacterium]
MEKFRLQIITPERVFFDQDVEMVEFNTTEGEIGVYAKHIPLTVIIKPGILTIRMENNEAKEAALHAGFVEILPDQVTILAEIVEWPEEIDGARAEAALERARARLASRTPETDIARAETALMRAMARITVIK